MRRNASRKFSKTFESFVIFVLGYFIWEILLTKITLSERSNVIYFRSIPTNTQPQQQQPPAYQHSTAALSGIPSRAPHLISEAFHPTSNFLGSGDSSWSRYDQELTIFSDQFNYHSMVVDKSGNKFTRQRERISRSLDKYWSSSQFSSILLTPFENQPSNH